MIKEGENFANSVQHGKKINMIKKLKKRIKKNYLEEAGTEAA